MYGGAPYGGAPYGGGQAGETAPVAPQGLIFRALSRSFAYPMVVIRVVAGDDFSPGRSAKLSTTRGAFAG